MMLSKEMLEGMFDIKADVVIHHLPAFSGLPDDLRKTDHYITQIFGGDWWQHKSSYVIDLRFGVQCRFKIHTTALVILRKRQHVGHSLVPKQSLVEGRDLSVADDRDADDGIKDLVFVEILLDKCPDLLAIDRISGADGEEDGDHTKTHSIPKGRDESRPYCLLISNY